jgi:hypothetical protein
VALANAETDLLDGTAWRDVPRKSAGARAGRH